MQSCYQQYQESNLKNESCLLNEQQELILWEQAIQQSKNDNFLFNNYETAKLAHASKTLINLWNIPISLAKQEYSKENQSFLEWNDNFQKLLDEHNFIESSTLANTLLKLFETNKIPMPSKIIFACFDEFIPSILTLKQTLEKLGCKTSLFDIPKIQSKSFVHAAKDQEQELNQLVCWAKNKYNMNLQIFIANKYLY